MSCINGEIFWSFFLIKGEQREGGLNMSEEDIEVFGKIRMNFGENKIFFLTKDEKTFL